MVVEAETVVDDPNQPTPEQVEEIRAEMEAVALDLGNAPKNDAERCVWAYVRMRARIQGEKQRIAEATNAMLRQLESQDRQLEYMFGSEVERATRDLLQGRREKSVKCPFGVAGFRKQPERVVISDEDRLHNAWAAADIDRSVASEVTTTTWKPDVAKINELYKATGEILPGCELQESFEKFYVK